MRTNARRRSMNPQRDTAKSVSLFPYEFAEHPCRNSMNEPRALPYVLASDYERFRAIMSERVPRHRELWIRWLDDQARQAASAGSGVRYVQIDLDALEAYMGGQPATLDALLSFAALGSKRS